ncbi:MULTISPECIES: HAS-barrel domain-containing protein [Thermoanaerobacterium]|uniref:HerA-ATP synthase, barrel domain protein n=1 Tax=Thermoanaerobacterium xylanolyticum (strain ATCC 49914 / DSM 7097 / LX-11) TaxID=858215 RepID=F6BLQ0_THEXL|nr:HAS-barrel domain-containing protein [Thermoanaerobacterium xylanolyticum]AEF17297.1 HerA-ATP synthase, barrel domain protein [Thermoanaerobacterium xylanolyticum LX-11]
MNQNHIGEVIETSTQKFLCQSIKLNDGPDFGSFVKTTSNDITIYGIVYNVSTMSDDQSRKPVAFGLSEEELKMQQPQIFELMHTYFEVQIIGYKKDRYIGLIPPKPAKIHAFTYLCDESDLKCIRENLNYIKYILNSKTGIEDELIAAAIRNLYSHDSDEKTYLIEVGKELIRLLKNDFDRYVTIKRMCNI